MSDLLCNSGGTMTHRVDDYSWYGDGSYEVYDCTCGQGPHYLELPD